MIDFIPILLFIVSLTLGTIYIYYSSPNKKKIYVFPTPENIDKLQYTDLTQNCFQYESQKVECPKDENKISNYIVQEGFYAPFE
jgi:hypothetical protein